MSKLLKSVLVMISLLLWTTAHSGGFYGGSVAGGYAQGLQANQQAELMNAQTQAITAWTNCMKAGGGNACGPAPQMSMQPQQPQQFQQYQQPTRTDFRCVSDCTAKGYMYQLCQQRCSF